MRLAPLFAALLAIPASAGPAPDPTAEEGFTPLVEGTDPEQFRLVEIDSGTITIAEDGVISLTGRPNGYFATEDSYENYVLRFDWMYERPDGLKDDAQFKGNSGVLVHIGGEHQVWPRCIEAQLMNRDAGHLFALKGGSFKSSVSDEDRKRAQREAIAPVGQWNSEEIVCRDGAISCSINGVLIDEGTGAEPDSGPIGWQSEGRPIKFRNLRIKPLD